MIPKKGGRKRGKKGGVIICQFCRQPLEKSGLYTPTDKEIRERMHQLCLVKAQNRDRDKRIT